MNCNAGIYLDGMLRNQVVVKSCSIYLEIIMSESIRDTLLTQRNQLLDLSYRNRLISLPKRKSKKSISVFDEISSEIFRLLVQEKKSLVFSALPDGSVDSEEVSTEELVDDEVVIHLPQPNDEDTDKRGFASRHSDNKLQTKLTSEHLQARLLDIFYESQTLVEEQGVNALFLALGVLRFNDPNKSKDEKAAPLILVPVKLERKSAQDRFIIKWNEEDPSENLSISEKLRAEFGIVLPNFPAIEDLKISDYFEKVNESVQSQSGWRVDSNVIELGFFSFAKLLMYLDLDSAKWPADQKIENHSLVSGLLGPGLASEPPLISDNQSIDSVLKVADMLHVVDCDSSQALAIEEIRKGRNLVIQGPPGTGKSQTITNLIATAIADGKKVLFVAEKMAALEVVKRRLEAIGLGQACLELHSNKTNKKSVLNEIDKTLALHAPVSKSVVNHIEVLEELRATLNNHAECMNTPIGKMLLTPYQILGELVRFKNTPKPPFKLSNAETWGRQDFEIRAQSLKQLAKHRCRVGKPSENIWRGVRQDVIMRNQAEDVIESISPLALEIASLFDNTSTLCASIGLPDTNNINGVKAALAIGRHLLVAPEFDKQSISSGVWNASVGLLKDSIANGVQFSEKRLKLDNLIFVNSLESDWSSQRKIIADNGKSLFRIFNSHYRQALRELKSACKAELPINYVQRLALLDEMIDAHNNLNALRRNETEAKAAFGQIWNDVDTDWHLAQSILQWVIDRPIGSDVKEVNSLAAIERNNDQLKDSIAATDSALKKLSTTLQAFIEQIDLDINEAFESPDIEQISLKLILDRINSWRNGIDSLMDWVAYNASTADAEQHGLKPVIEAIQDNEDAWSNIDILFSYAFYLRMLECVQATYPSFARFDQFRHNEVVKQFIKYDLERIELAKTEAALAHYQSIPSGSLDIGSLGILRTEIRKKSRHMAIRQLLKRCASPIQSAKPVFMMSPVSVAQYLEPGALSFDLLVIDEASQVQPVDSLGAIARSKQIVVVGDDKQLPPTSFFTRMVADDEIISENEESYSQIKDLESVLSLCLAKGLPQRMLRWHYRSQHESLIALSNKEFYDGGLYVVPSPSLDRKKLGLSLTYLPEGRFDRGNTGKNQIEARAIAQAVMDHAQNSPDLSLGVGAMSIRQRDAILDELELKRREHPELEGFFNNHPYEPFFVKNLENIQGDERDVIMISVGYAKSIADDKLRQNYGPLNSDGGHRRLNVLITRSKRRCIVFSSILADEIRVDENSKQGVVAFKAFLKYALTGQIDIPRPSGKEADSPFEEDVQQVISQYGFEVVNQVGVSGFFIDLAVIDPDNPGSYLLGIECDGATYHSARSARDRDRLRQQILEAQGWRIHRIWSTDWFQREASEVKRVLEAISQAKLARNENKTRLPSPPVINSAPIRVEPDSTAKNPSSLSIPYQLASFQVPRHLGAPHEVPLLEMTEVVYKIIETEGPVHQTEITTRVRELWGLGRAGARIQAAVGSALNQLTHTKKVLVESDCYMLPNTQPILRNRLEVVSNRRPELLPPQEIRAGIIKILKEVHSASAEELVLTLSRQMGFSATSQQLKDIFTKQIVAMCDSGAIKADGSLISEANNITKS